MKRILAFATIAAVFTLLSFSCGGEMSEPHPFIPTGKAMSAVVVQDTWSKSVATETEGNYKWVSNIPAGSAVTYTGVAKRENLYAKNPDGSFVVDAKGNKAVYKFTDYIKVRDQSGNEGYMYWGTVILNAKPAVLIKETEEYSQPAETASLYKKHPVMQFLGAVLDDKGSPQVQNGFQKVSPLNDVYFWVKSSDVSASESDVGLAKRFNFLIYNKEMPQAEVTAKLKELVDDQQYARSPFIAKIRDEYKKRSTAESVNATIIATPDKK